MGLRRKIKIVAGVWSDHVMIALWEGVARIHDVEILVLQDQNDSQIRTSLSVKLFPQIPEMPGFYRDLERFLAGADLVIGLESTRLHSFQTLRCAKSMGIPCAILSHDFTPMFYDKFANIRAIQFDIIQNADLFLTSSHRATRLLYSLGAVKDRVKQIPHHCDSQRDTYDATKGAKFRNYLGVRPDELLVVGRSHFAQNSGASEILKGVRKAMTSLPVPIAARMRILLIGLGSEVDDLKYQAVDLGLGSRAIFMNQDPQPFWRDVASAAHLVIWDRWYDKDHVEPYPFAMMSGLTSGVQTAIPVASLFDEASSGLPIQRLQDVTALDISETLDHVFSRIDQLTTDRVDLGNQTAEAFAIDRAVSSLLEHLQPFLTNSSAIDVRSRIEQFVEVTPSPLPQASARDIVIKVEEALLVPNLARETVAELWRIKADALMAQSLGEESMSAFEKAIQLNSQCFRAQRGLGYLAWQGHSHEDAIGFFKRALAIEPNDYHSTVGVGLVYRRLRMLEESVFWLHKAVELGGPESSSMGLLVQACVESAESPTSLGALERLRLSFGDVPVVLRGLSQIYLAQGRADEAGPLLDQAAT